MSEVDRIRAVSLGLASPEMIRDWSHGEVTKPETINYRTQRPERDGLLCERIFGPTKDWECGCGKYRRAHYRGIICERCGVEVTRARVRRERMGHIELAAPVAHIWFTRGIPARLPQLLDMTPKDVERVAYYTAWVVTWIDSARLEADTAALADALAAHTARIEAGAAEQLAALRDRHARRSAFLSTGARDGLDEFDEEWAQSLTDEARPAAQAAIDEHLAQDEQVLAEMAAHDIANVTRAHQLLSEITPGQIIAEESDAALLEEYAGRDGAPLGDLVRIDTGAEAIRRLLLALSEPAPDASGLTRLDADYQSLRARIAEGKGRERDLKRLRTLAAFVRSGNRPEWMVLTALPVLPPDLRPMVQLDGGRFATSDLNDLYRRVINRNNRLARLIETGAPRVILNNERRMLQEAVDALFDNGRRGRAVTGNGGRQLKSLADMLKGKQGRFRQNLLGKRVDYSGRSVIVSGPELALHECGLPRTMALELFKPFVINRIAAIAGTENLRQAKQLVDDLDERVWDALEQAIADHPVLLNRAPTLHRLSIQAFIPRLVDGNAIQLHPLVCTAFNADFDGDQMAVHVPLTPEACAEARVLMLSANNILSPATGRTIALPSQDMVLGLYMLTRAEQVCIDGQYVEATTCYDPRTRQRLPGMPDTLPPVLPVYRDRAGVVRDHRTGVRARTELVVLRAPGAEPVVTTVGRCLFTESIADRLREIVGADEYAAAPFAWHEQTLTKRVIGEVIDGLVSQWGADVVSGVLDVVKDMGFRYATRAGVSLSKSHIRIPAAKEEILAGHEQQVRVIEELYLDGLMSDAERAARTIETWEQATEEVSQAMIADLLPTNPLFVMADSGARGSFKQIRQLAGMRGLMSNTRGETIERPIKANFMEGLSVLEYFISTHGARKGLADTALKTADSGYLTRRLVDVAQDVIIRDTDCGTPEGLPLSLMLGDQVNPSLAGRVTTAGQRLDPEVIDALIDAGEEEVWVRSPLTCAHSHGLCAMCYGTNPATGSAPEIGDVVGIMAAQSIGEPGTQLTMRTFHTGGVAGDDITQGLPRVVELFEGRTPKAPALLAPHAGWVRVVDEGVTEARVSVVSIWTDPEGNTPETELGVAPRSALRIADGEFVAAGAQLSAGSCDLTGLLAADPGVCAPVAGTCTDASRGRASRGQVSVSLVIDGQAWVGRLPTARADALIAAMHTPLPVAPGVALDAGRDPVVRAGAYLVAQVQGVYRDQGVEIDDRHIEVIARQMLRRVRVLASGDSHLAPGQIVDRTVLAAHAASVLAEGGEPPRAEPVMLGITRASLTTDSFLAAASFQETNRVLVEAALDRKRDELRGLKENVILGKLIPAATGLARYASLEVRPVGTRAHSERLALGDPAPHAEAVEFFAPASDADGIWHFSPQASAGEDAAEAP